MGCHNYFINAGSDSNLLLAWSEIKKAGIGRAPAVTALAISANETGWVWGQPRGTDRLYFPPFECDDCRQVVGWEFTRTGDGKLAVRALPKDPRDLDWAVQNEILTPQGRPGPALLDKRKLAATAKWFEYAIHTRDVGVLGNFSVGPTQMFLHPRESWGHWNATFKKDWEKLWEFYTTTNAGKVMSYVQSYFGPGPYPGTVGVDDATAINWLKARQTGGGTGPSGKLYAEEYWYGLGGFKNMKANVARVHSLIDKNPNA